VPLVLTAGLELTVGQLGRPAPEGALVVSRQLAWPAPRDRPPGRVVVPVKYSSTSSGSGRSPSKTWRAVYDATVEMPIFDMILSTPLPAALM